MPEALFGGLLIVVVVGFAAPLALGFFPRSRLPSPVVEIVLGIAIGPAALGWVTVDEPIRILALVGLAFLFFLGGLEVEVQRLRGRLLGLAGSGLAASLAIALALSFAFKGAGLVESPLLVAVILTSTGLGVLIPILKDVDQTRTEFGQLVIVWASLADFGAIILLTLLFSSDASGPGSRAILLLGFVLVCAAVGFGVARAARSTRVAATIERLQGTTAQIRVRGSMVLLIGLAAVAERLGLETILGAFLAGAILSAVDRDRTMTHPHFRVKLEAMGFGLFVPVFFVTSGLNFDLHALTSSPSAWHASHSSRPHSCWCTSFPSSLSPVARSEGEGRSPPASTRPPRSRSWSRPCRSARPSGWSARRPARRSSRPGSSPSCCSRWLPGGWRASPGLLSRVPAA